MLKAESVEDKVCKSFPVIWMRNIFKTGLDPPGKDPEPTGKNPDPWRFFIYYLVYFVYFA